MKRLYAYLIRLNLTISLAFLFITGFSQRNGFTGYYISSDGDSIAGTFPAYRQWNFNPSRVDFKPVQGNSVVLTPLNTRKFVINGYDTYLAFTGQRLINPLDYQSAASAPESDQFEPLDAFLREITGTEDFTFYTFKDKLRFNLFYREGNGKPVELLQKAAFVNNSFWQSMTYKKQLSALFPAREKDIALLQYTEPAIERFIRISGPSTPAAVISTSKKKHAQLFLIGGVAANTLRFETNQSLAFSTMDYTSSIAPLGGIGYMIPLQRNFSRAFFFPQVKILSFKHSGTTIYNEGYPAFKNTFKAAPMIAMGIYAGYHILYTKTVRFSLAPGAGLSFLAKNQQVDEAMYSPTQTRTLVTDMHRVAPLFDIQAMATIKGRFMLWASYNFPTAVTDSQSARGRLQSVQGGIGYTFR